MVFNPVFKLAIAALALITTCTKNNRLEFIILFDFIYILILGHKYNDEMILWSEIFPTTFINILQMLLSINCTCYDTSKET